LQWAPPRPNFDPFAGEILRTAVNGTSVQHGLLRDQTEMRRSLAIRPFHFHLDAIAPAPREGRLVLLSRLMGTDGEALLVAQSASSFLVRVGLRASDFQLRPLWVSVPAPGDSAHRVEIDIQLDRQGVEVTAAGSGGTRHRRIAFEPTIGWVFLVPVEFSAGGWLRVGSAIWIALWSLPVGFLGRARSAARVVPVAVLIAGLAFVPIITSMATLHWSGWVGACGGVWFGWLIRLRVGRGRAG
jgi:hypothetical protein